MFLEVADRFCCCCVVVRPYFVYLWAALSLFVIDVDRCRGPCLCVVVVLCSRTSSFSGQLDYCLECCVVRCRGPRLCCCVCCELCVVCGVCAVCVCLCCWWCDVMCCVVFAFVCCVCVVVICLYLGYLIICV
jgi:hypothetical protein